MKREMLVVVVIVVAAALVLGVGIYLLATSFHPTIPPATGPGAATDALHWNATLESGLTYSGPVLGPTTPLSDTGGGLWVINPAAEGVILMNLSMGDLLTQSSPFVAGHDSLRRDLSADFGESARPLGPVYYIVPARDAALNGTTGPTTRNGALAFFAGADFVAADPFNDSVFFHYTLPFVPTWTGEDPASAGNLLLAPVQRVVSVGVVSIPVGPYRYFWASDGSHTVVLEITYIHAGYCACAAPSGRLVLAANVSLSAPPFVYYNQEYVNATTQYRSGPGAAILLPLTNHTVEVLDTRPVVRAWVPLTLGGQAADVVGDIGYVQATYPLHLLLPVRSSSSTGLVVLDLGQPSTAFEHVAGDAGWVPVGIPQARLGSAVYMAWYDPAADATRFLGVNGTGGAIPQYAASVPGRARSVFLVSELTRVFVETEAGSVDTLNTTYASAANITPVAFHMAISSPSTLVVYAGSAGGTRFGSTLTPQELLAAWTDPVHATTTLSRLVYPVTIAAASAAGVDGLVLRLPAMLPAASLGAVRAGRRTSCNARASGPRPSGRRTRA